MPTRLEALELTSTLRPQTKVEVSRGLRLRLTKNAIPILALHYTAQVHPTA
jgi:hypothetical protein